MMLLKSLTTLLFLFISGIIYGQDEFLPPDSLHATQKCDNIILEWSAPQETVYEISGYHVYLADSLLTFTIDTSFQIQMQGNSIVTFSVSAVYNAGESAPATVEVELVTYAPARNLTYTSYDCEFSWSPPLGNMPAFPVDSAGSMKWCDNYKYDQVGTGGPVEFDVAVRWAPFQLNQFSNGPLLATAIDFFPCESAATYRVRIWQGDEAEQMIYEQEVTDFMVNEWNHIILSDSVLININQELWIGYNVNTPTGFPAGCDNGPAIDGYGNMMNFGGWQTLLEINPDLDYNWNIRAEILYTFLGELTYDIIAYESCYPGSYWQKVNDWPITDTSFWYACILPTNTLMYNDFFVRVNYCNVAINSDTVELDICWASQADQTDSSYLNLLNIYQTGQEWIINAEVGLTQISIYDLTGRNIFRKKCDLKELRINHQIFPPGIYLIEATTDSGRYSKKIFK